MKRMSPIKGAAVMTVFSLICKLIGTLQRLYTASRIGSEGMGLYSLIMSVYTLFTAISNSWITPAVSRLAAKHYAKDEKSGYMMFLSCVLPSLVIGLISMLAMYLLAEPLAANAINDINTCAALRALSLSLPCMSLTSCIKGLFLAKGEILKNSTGSLTEQIIKTLMTMLILGRYMLFESSPARLCLGITIGVTSGEMFSLLYLGTLLLLSKSERKRISPSMPMISELLSVGAPMLASTSATSLLHTAESVLIPMMLLKYSGDRSQALCQFGEIRGMAMPLIFFPFAFLGGLSVVLVPEISRLSASDDKNALAKQISKSLTIAYLFGIMTTGIFFFLSESATNVFYPHSNAAFSVKIIALIAMPMYVETVADSMLKALGQEKRQLLYCLINSAFRITALLAVVPRLGIYGYLGILIVSNILQYILAINRLHKVVRYRIVYTKAIALPFVGSAVGGIAASSLQSLLLPSEAAKLIASCFVFAIFFLPFCIPILKEVKK